MVRTLPFHGRNTDSNSVEVTILDLRLKVGLCVLAAKIQVRVLEIHPNICRDSKDGLCGRLKISRCPIVTDSRHHFIRISSVAEYLTPNQKTCVRFANSLPFLNRRKYAKFLVSSYFFKESSKRNK